MDTVGKWCLFGSDIQVSLHWNTSDDLDLNVDTAARSKPTSCAAARSNTHPKAGGCRAGVPALFSGKVRLHLTDFCLCCRQLNLTLYLHNTFLELCHGRAAETQAPAALATAAKMNVLRHQRRLHMCGTWKFGFGTWLGACISFVFFGDGCLAAAVAATFLVRVCACVCVRV